MKLLRWIGRHFWLFVGLNGVLAHISRHIESNPVFGMTWGVCVLLAPVSCILFLVDQRSSDE